MSERKESIIEKLEYKMLLTPAEAAALTGIAENLIRDLCRYQLIPCLTSNKSDTPAYKIGREALLEWIDDTCKNHINLNSLINELSKAKKQALRQVI